jgi:pimeloyl-[acyl-carrier protein] synthase
MTSASEQSAGSSRLADTQSRGRFHPLRPEVLADPYPAYAAMREGAPVLWDRRFGWLIFRHEDVAAGLRDARLSARRPGPEDPIPRVLQPVAEDVRAVRTIQGRWLLCADPPRHTELRTALGASFTARFVENLRPRIESLLDTLLDRVAASGRFDVIADVAYPLPATIIAELLGVPLGDLEQFKQWSDDVAGSFTLAPDTMQRASAALGDLTEYVADLVSSKGRYAAHDLLPTGYASGLPKDDVVAQSVMLLFAGHATTTNLIGNGVLALLRHPDELARLRAEPGLITSAVEELLRYDSPTQATFRSVAEDFDLRGQRLHRGDPVLLMLGSANRDPSQFREPDALDLTRAENRHLAFSQGPHFCLGAPLARLEGQIAIRRIIERFPHLCLDEAEPVWRPNVFLRGLESLRVEI